MSMCESYLTKTYSKSLRSKFLQVHWDSRMPPLWPRELYQGFRKDFGYLVKLGGEGVSACLQFIQRSWSCCCCCCWVMGQEPCTPACGSQLFSHAMESTCLSPLINTHPSTGDHAWWDRARLKGNVSAWQARPAPPPAMWPSHVFEHWSGRFLGIIGWDQWSGRTGS